MAIDLRDSSKLVIEESRRLIDLQKVELYESIRKLNSRRNELAPISVLPPELLGRIFTFLNPNGTSYHSSTFMLFFSFTFVSQNWRNVALNTPDLWNTPTFHYPVWGRAMLERSKMTDLVVRCRTNPVDRGLMKEVFDNHSARIREIDFEGLNPSTLWELENVQPFSLCLRSLRLSDIDYWTVSDPALPVFPSQLLVQSDSLRHLEIRFSAFNVYAQPRPMLTHLSVCSPRDCPLLSEFVRALSGMPALETLEMKYSLPLATHAVKLDLKVELPKLSSLLLHSVENPFQVLNVVDFLIVPWSTRVDISCSNLTISQPNETASDTVSPLGLFFSRMTGNVERRSYDRLYLHNDVGGLSLLAWKSMPADDCPPTELPDLLLSTFEQQSHESSYFLDEILRHLSSPDLKTLSMNINLGPDIIHRLFGQSTTIKTVELHPPYLLTEFLQVLTHKPEGYERLESSYQTVSFPALRSLVFIEMIFQYSILKQLLDTLMERYERGAPLEKLTFGNCYNIDNEEVRLLREVVPDVEWDEIVQVEDDFTGVLHW